ncbi:hypothetical protein SPAN111604_05430 [Sphingomonas antarctica]|uniref:hypothetical protein n=1 Tax=Sphingomonas antarctica TaxID=2040274 RepID=UPI0039E75BE7
MSKLSPRIERLETRRLTVDARVAQIEEHAAEVTSRLTSIAANMDQELAQIDEADWARFAPAQKVAWAVRFANWPLDYAIAKMVQNGQDHAVA